MKLGEALRLRSDNYKKIAELKTRAVASAQTQEGADAPDNPGELLDTIERLSAQTLNLVQRINRTNVETMLPDGRPLVDALAERDYILVVRSPFEAVAEAASAMQQRYMRSEIRIVRNVDPVALRGKADELARRHRLLDVAIQEANWVTDLVE
jgi:phage protein D